VTEVSCLAARRGERAELAEALTLTHDTLRLRKGVMTYDFIRVPDLPERCDPRSARPRREDALCNFDVFAATVTEHYPFLDLNGIDWEELRRRQRGKLNSGSGPRELYRVLAETMDRLGDNHGYLEVDAATELPLEQSEPVSTVAGESLPTYGDFEIAELVAEHHLEEEMTRDSWLMRWGKLADGIGYAQIKAMWLYADLDLAPDSVEANGFVDAYVNAFQRMDESSYIEAERRGAATLIDTMMADLRQFPVLVLDLRFNGGGQDAVSFELLSRFNDRRRPVVRTKLRHGEGYTTERELYLPAVAEPYTGRTYLLLSDETGSAAEAFAIGSLPLRRIQRIGSGTQGALSTALEKTLPNGWAFAISHEVYMDYRGRSYENIGVPVDNDLGYSDDRQTFFRSVANDLDADKGDILSAVRRDD
jgi:hypothetical protein